MGVAFRFTDTPNNNGSLPTTSLNIGTDKFSVPLQDMSKYSCKYFPSWCLWETDRILVLSSCVYVSPHSHPLDSPVEILSLQNMCNPGDFSQAETHKHCRSHSCVECVNFDVINSEKRSPFIKRWCDDKRLGRRGILLEDSQNKES